jgi:hypothetical protein
VVDAVRERLGVGGAPAAPGGRLYHQLIRSLLHHGALLPSDLHLSAEETVPPGGCAAV